MGKGINTTLDEGQTPIVTGGFFDDATIAFDTTQITHPENRSNPQLGDPSHPLASGAHPPAVAYPFAEVADPVAANQGRTYTREGSNNFRMSNVAIQRVAVRRLTPRECERLQGFPDDYTLIPVEKRRRIEADEYAYLRRTYPDMPEDEARRLAADGPRYKALGNTMAVPVMAWIGRRIALAEEVLG